MRYGSNGVSAAALLACLGAGAAAAAAQPADEGAAAPEDDGYCDWVEGTAAAQSAVLWSPEVFGSFGYLDQTGLTVMPDATGNDLRVTAGLRYSLSGLHQGYLTRARAEADCRRHEALGELEQETAYRALQARARVLDKALSEAEGVLDSATNDFEQRQSSLQELTATRLRVDGLRALAAETKRQLGAAPPAKPTGFAGSVENYYAADADVEREEARLRFAQAWDVSLRVGYDRFLEDDTEDSPLFALASISFNIGALFQGGSNETAAAGRARYVRAQRAGPNAVTLRRLRATAEAEKRREKETAALLADLEKQLAELDNLTSVTSRRYRETVWFEWVKVKAEHEYLRIHVATLSKFLREQPE
jgi:hypothetical protein